MIFTILQLLLLLVLLALVISMYIMMNSMKAESYCNCFGAQYDGTAVLSHPKAPLCAEQTSEPLYRTGGCVSYDPSVLQRKYEEGKVRPKGV